ncbi:MAG: hypothetical protein JSR47_19065 [Proteobacteria bacterium]|nr:hypothetical protein [Pseudomonadota bacterium]
MLLTGFGGGIARADGGLDAGGLTFKDFAVADNGASFNRTDPMLPGGPEPARAQLLGIDTANGLARVLFKSVKAEISLPLGWQATEDADRGVGFSADRQYRVLVWRVDFAFEGVRDAEHYAATKVGAITARRPGVKGQARKLADGVFLILYENVPPSRGDSGTRTVFDVVMAKPGNPKEGVLMTLGVPSADSGRGLNLLALLKSRLVITW